MQLEMTGPGQEDPLDQACKLLGIQVLDQGQPPARIPKVINGHACLVFKSESERSKQLKLCKGEVTARCSAGSRSSCSLKAMDQCRGPGFLRWLGLWRRNPAATAACEEKFMQECLDSALPSCSTHAASFCESAFPMQLCSHQPFNPQDDFSMVRSHEQPPNQ